jgi:drug/metabolite transporter (DMT)-like permease
MEPGIFFGVGSAASFGAGDFAGGSATRRASGVGVAAGAQVVGLVLLLAAVALLRPAAPVAGAVSVGAAAGIFGGLGLVALYRGLSLGSMGVVTALSGVGSVLLPFLVSVFLRGSPISAPQAAGVGLALAAAAAASGATLRGVRPEAIRLALAAAVGLGLWFVLLDVAAESGELWALVGSRGSASLVVGALAVLRGGGRGLLAVWPLVLAAGAMDVVGNATFVLARASIPVGIAAALSGLYPIVTMLLARALLRESLPRLGVAAVLLAVAGIGFISAG